MDWRDENIKQIRLEHLNDDESELIEVLEYFDIFTSKEKLSFYQWDKTFNKVLSIPACP